MYLNCGIYSILDLKFTLSPEYIAIKNPFKTFYLTRRNQAQILPKHDCESELFHIKITSIPLVFHHEMKPPVSTVIISENTDKLMKHQIVTIME